MNRHRITIVPLIAGLLVAVWFQYRAQLSLRQENEALRKQVQELMALREAPSAPVPAANTHSVSDEDFRELLRLRGEAAMLRQRLDFIRKQAESMKAASPPVPGQLAPVNMAWVEQVLNGPPKEQGGAAGLLRGKLLRRETTNVSPSELSLQQELLKRELNQTLERSPAEFADFQSAFIQNAIGISDAAKLQQIHDLIQKTYESAVASGLDIPSKPAAASEDWVQRRFQLDRAATSQLQQLLSPEERQLFDRAFLGVMGVDLGGTGVDKSNYPRGFAGP
jgi:hypothetical protein